MTVMLGYHKNVEGAEEFFAERGAQAAAEAEALTVRYDAMSAERTTSIPMLMPAEAGRTMERG